ncbi:Uncharacterised protein [Chlamydia trachomatis]|nr:Uncharacterised protein [Chlamydia trachomatis]
MIVAEVRLASAGGKDQRVVGSGLLFIVVTPNNDFVFNVDVFNERLQNANILLLLENLTRRWCNVAFGEDASCDLIEQGLE